MMDVVTQPANPDPFAAFDPEKVGDLGAPKPAATSTPAPQAAAAPSDAPAEDPFAKFDPYPQEKGALQAQASGIGAFASYAGASVLPALAGLKTVGYGAATGARVGAALGAFGGPLAEYTVPIGGFVGGVGGGIGALYGTSYAVEKAQNYALSKLPDSWVDALGQSERQRQADQAQHPYASFIGGLAPYALTMRPGGFGSVALPAEATAYQRIMANPVTARLFGGAVQGGMELGQEKLTGQQADWTKVGIATSFGTVFNKPTRFGELLHGGVAPEAAPAVEAAGGTVAQAADAKVIGPGITEEVFQGTHQQQPEAEMTAQDTARTEAGLRGAPQPGPDLHAVARQMHPELFEQYDGLSAQRDQFRKTIADAQNPPDDVVAEATAKRDEIQQQLDQVPTSGAGRNLVEARRLRAQVRDAQRGVDDLEARRSAYAEGRAVDTPEVTAARQQLQAVDYQMRDLSTDVSAAYRRAADATSSGTVPPVPLPEEPPAAAPGQFSSMAQMLADRGEMSQNPASNDAAKRDIQADTNAAPGTSPVDKTASNSGSVDSGVSQQPGAPPPAATFDIAADVARQLIAAGRPEAEAIAAGRLAAARYQTRAARFKGALGSAEDVYRSASPELRGPDGRLIAGPAAAPTPRAIPEATAPLMPTPERPTIGKTPAIQATATSQFAADLSPRSFGVPAGGLEALDPADIGVDATRFQFKAGGDASGVTERLQGVTTWDPRLAGTTLVFRDAEGKNWVADGHQRVGLAKRLAAEGQDGIRVNSFVLDAKDGITDSQARVIAGMKNIAEGTGTAIDAAKVIREAKDTGADLPPLPPRSALVRDGQALARLGPDAFGMAVNEVVPTQQAALVGRLINDPLQQAEAMRVLAKAEPENLRQTEMIVREIMATGTEEMTRQGGLFGDEQFASSIVLERAKIADEAMRQLKKDKATFSTLVAEAERIEGAGANALDRDANKGRLSTDEQAVDLFTSLATHAGPVSDALSGIARRFKSGSISAAAAGREFLGALREAVEGRVDDGADARGAVPGAAGERAGTESAFELAQGQPAEEADPNQQAFFQSVNGKIRFTDGRRPLITLTKHADASTFVHETGHAWLEELMQDAAHPAAPDDVKADARSVLNWLRVDGPGDIKTSQHERFATGFEQYLREGVAPTPGLAGVFAKFRNWLVTIYQSLKGLGPEISSDIRGVFDRLLSTEPNRTVIAPEREGVPSLGDLHTADAAAIEPHEAEGGMDRVKAESVRAVAEAPTEIQRELEAAQARTVSGQDGEGSGQATGLENSGRPGDVGADIAGENGAVPIGSRQVDGRGGGSDSVAGRGGSGASAAPVGEGGGDARTESNGLRGVEQSGSASGRDAGGAFAPTPGARVRPEQSRFVDKAGNIRLELLTDDQDVRQAIRDAAAENNDFIGDRKGAATPGQIMDLAQSAGFPDAMKIVQERVAGQGFSSVEVSTLRVALRSAAEARVAAAQKASSGRPEDLLAYAQVREQQRLIQGTVAAATAEWGRTGRALQDIRKIAGTADPKQADMFARQTTGLTLYQLKREADLVASFQTPDQVSKFSADTTRPSAGRLFLEIYVNGLISGPTTHVTYAIGNTILTASKMLLETPTAAAYAAVRRAMGLASDKDGARFGEVIGQLRGAKEGFFPAVQAFLDAGRMGGTTLLPGEQGSQLPFQFNDLARAATLDEHATAFSIVQGLRDGILAAGGMARAAASDLASGSRDDRLFSLQHDPASGYWPNVAIRGVTALPVGDFVRAPGRNVAAIHSFFRAMNYSIDKGGQAYRIAANEGLTGNDFAARVGDVMTSPSDAVMEAARKTSTSLTLMGQGGELVRRIAAVTNWETKIPGLGYTQPFKFVDPFVKISGNIMNQGLMQRSPIGLFAPEIQADLAGKNGEVARDFTAGRLIAGSALAITFGGLAAQGLVTGSGRLGKSDEDTRAMQAADSRAGIMPHSMRIGSQWYDLHRLGPLGMLMSVAADMHEVVQYAREEDLAKVGASLLHGFAQNILDEGWAKGPADLLQALTNSGQYGEHYVQSELSGFIPYSSLLGQMARAGDPYVREARTIMDGIREKLPGERESLMPKIDIYGEPIRNHGAVISPYVTAISTSPVINDPVDKALEDIDVHPAPVNRDIRGVKLDDQQYNDYARIAGRLLKTNLNRIVRSEQWSNFPLEARRITVQHALTGSRETAANMVMMKYPAIPATARAQKVAKLTGP